MKKITVDPKTKRVRVQTINTEPSKTQQQFKDAVDVNKIIAKYKRTGDTRLLESAKQGVFADTTLFTDYQSAANKVIEAQRAFEQLPSDVRLRFNHDPQQLINFLQDPKNVDESLKLGLRVKKVQTGESVKQSDTQNAQKDQTN